MSQVLYVRLPDDLMNAIRAEAEAEELTLTSYVRFVLEGRIRRG